MKNTIKNVWSLICQKAIIDTRTSLVSLIDLIEKIDVVVENVDGKESIFKDDKNTVLKNPVLFPAQFTLVNYWEVPKDFEDKEISIRVLIMSPSGKSLGSADFQFRTEKGKNYHRTLTEFQSLPVIESGTYFFELQTKTDDSYTKIGSIPLAIGIIKNDPKIQVNLAV